MDSPVLDTESGIASELIDLDAVSLTELRSLDHTKLHEAMRHVVEQASRMRVNGDGSKGGVLID
jgi:hypothetical protein